MKKPNIIFYFSDQQRYDTLSVQVTPNLNELQKTASSFSNAFTCQPVCGPARACLQSGQYASNIGCYKNDVKLPENIDTLAKLLTAQNYDTAYIGKWHLASNGLSENYQTKPTPQSRRGGYRYWRAADCLEFTSNGYGGYVYDNDGKKCNWSGVRAEAINNFALEYLDTQYTADKPFFMFISQLDPHHQNGTDKYECPQGGGEEFKDYPIPQDLSALHGNYGSRYADYLACCKAVDTGVGRLISKLKAMNIWDNTILIYTSDHGCHFRTRNMEYKRSCHDASIHVPLIISGGEFNTGKSFDNLVSLIDLPKTILSLASAQDQPLWQGYDVRKIINGADIRDSVYIEITESQLGRAIRTQDYTYSVRARGSFGIEKPYAKKYIEDKLYDIKSDPNQLSNKIRDPKYKDVRKILRNTLIAEIKALTDQDAIILPKLTNLNVNEKLKK